MSTLVDVKEYLCGNNMEKALHAIELLNADESEIGKVVKSRILVDKGELTESADIVNEILTQPESNNIVKFGAIMSKIHLLWKTGRYNEIEYFMQEGNNVLETIQDKKSDLMLWFMGNYYNGIGNYYWDKGSLTEALNSYIQAYELRKKLGNKVEMAKSLTNLGNIHYIRGEYDLALDKYQETILLKKEVGENVDLSAVLSNIGAVHLDKGELNSALINFNQSLRYLSNSNDEAAKAFRHTNIGHINIIKGNLDEALEYLERANSIHESLNNKFLLARSLNFIGQVYLSQNKLDQASKYLNLSLENHRFFENGYQVSKTLLTMIQTKIEQNLKEDALSYLNELETIHNQKSNGIVTLRYLLAKALIFKNEPRLMQKYNTQALFQDIINNPLLTEIIKMEARLGFCELLVMEYEMLKNNETKEELLTLVDQIYKYGQLENAYSYITKSIIIKSRILFTEDNVVKAYKLLEIADYYCEERKLNLCQTKIIETRNMFNSTIKGHKELTSTNLDSSKMKINPEIMEYLEDLKRIKFDRNTSSQ